MKRSTALLRIIMDKKMKKSSLSITALGNIFYESMLPNLNTSSVTFIYEATEYKKGSEKRLTSKRGKRYYTDTDSVWSFQTEWPFPGNTGTLRIL